MKPTIVFVDDEAAILAGLKRSFYSQKAHWTIHYCNGGAEALDIIKNNPVDVIISDMRMPEMDGAELLRQTMDIQPDVTRIVLSGQTDPAEIYRLIDSSHQYIAKPCTNEILVDIIERAVNVRSLMTDKEQRAHIGQLKFLPPQATICQQLTQELDKPEPSLKNLSAIIIRDAGLITKIMQAVSSGYFVQEARKFSVSDAVEFLGSDRIAKLTTHQRTEPTSNKHYSMKTIEEQWYRNTLVAHLARSVAQAGNLDEADQEAAFLAGILHNIGNILHQNENYAPVGGYILGLWGFAETIIRAVAYHNAPADAPQKDGFDVLSAVHIADALSHNEGERRLDMNYIHTLGSEKRINEWLSISRDMEFGENLYG